LHWEHLLTRLAQVIILLVEVVSREQGPVPPVDIALGAMEIGLHTLEATIVGVAERTVVVEGGVVVRGGGGGDGGGGGGGGGGVVCVCVGGGG
jgi:hypothetical protein